MNFTILKIVSVVALMIGCFFGGWFANNKPPIVETKVETVEKVVTKIVTEKVSNPNGTTTEKTTTETTEDTKTKAKEKEPVPPSKQASNKYSLGIVFDPRMYGDQWGKVVGVSFGYRLIGPLWTAAEYNWMTKGITLGVRYEF